MSTNIQTWYNFVLQQMAAESYLNGWNDLSGIDQQNRLLLGNNNYNFLQADQTPTSDILPGATRLTATQAADFTARYQVIDHRSNDDARFATQGVNAQGVNIQIGNGSGLSATLMFDTVAQQYTLSVRSTEYRDNADGGDWERDGYFGADGELMHPDKGFAFAQIAALEEYYQTLIAQGTISASTPLNLTELKGSASH